MNAVLADVNRRGIDDGVATRSVRLIPAGVDGGEQFQQWNMRAARPKGRNRDIDFPGSGQGPVPHENHFPEADLRSAGSAPALDTHAHRDRAVRQDVAQVERDTRFSTDGRALTGSSTRQGRQSEQTC